MTQNRVKSLVGKRERKSDLWADFKEKLLKVFLSKSPILTNLYFRKFPAVLCKRKMRQQRGIESKNKIKIILCLLVSL